MNIVAPRAIPALETSGHYNSKPIAIGEGSTQAGSLELVDVLANDKDPNEGTVLTVTLPEDTEVNINGLLLLLIKIFRLMQAFMLIFFLVVMINGVATPLVMVN